MMNNNLLKVPAKYSRFGIKVKCLKCKFNVGSKCGLTSEPIRNCENKERHKYNLVVCVPGAEGKRRTKIVHTRDFNEAIQEMTIFRSELEYNNYSHIRKEQDTSTKLEYFMTAYLDAISGVNTPAHLIRKRSKSHIDETVRVFIKFKHALTEKGYIFKLIDAKEITDNEVGIFHHHLIDELKLSLSSYNKYMGIMKTLYYWIQRVKDYPVTNVFKHVVLQTVKKDVEIISKSEFEKLLKSVNRENSLDPRCNRYLYREWLVHAYELGLESGLRREELLTVKWSNIIDIGEGKQVLKIRNLKVNRIMTGLDTGEHHKFIPVTKSLRILLNELGYENQKGTEKLIVARPTDQSMQQAMDILSRSFSHFMSVAGNRPLKFKVLRKTYLTSLAVAAGPNAKLFTGSSSDEVLKNHYLSEVYMTAQLEDFSVFK